MAMIAPQAKMPPTLLNVAARLMLAVMDIEPPALDLFRIDDDAPPFVPAVGRRAWMDATSERYAYRCIPMTIANASGWEVRCPFAFEVTWNGGSGLDAIGLCTAAPRAAIERLITSHFGHGIITFHTGWLIRTSPGWALWARGSPNQPKPGITALEGLVETEWLPFPFTMNWRFDAPGAVRFDANEPFCFITPIPHATLDRIQPTIRHLSDDPELEGAYQEWQASRSDFNARLRDNEADAVAQGWQRTYVRGEREAGRTSGFHVTKRALKKPRAR